MISIRTKDGMYHLLDPRTQDKDHYTSVLKFFISMVKPENVMEVTASGDHLHDIITGFDNIPKPSDSVYCKKFTWLGVYAETLVANVLNSLYDGDSFIIQQVKDISKYGTMHQYR